MAQQLSFKHLGVEEGMPSNITSHACFDSSGLIWISSYDGLIGYDGNRIRQYVTETHAGLSTNFIEYLYCDSRNQVWMCTETGLSILDEHRRIKKITISDTIKNKDINHCVEVIGLGMLAFAPTKTYLLPNNKTAWKSYKWFDEEVRKGADIVRISAFSKTAFMFIADKRAMLVDFATKKTLIDITIPNVITLCKLNEKELLAISSSNFEMYVINIATATITKKYKDIKDENGNPLKTAIVSCTMAANGIVYITTRSKGLVAFNPATEKFISYDHQPLIKNSISSNSLRRLYCHENGYMIITSTTGINFTNVLIPMLKQQNKFVDDKGNAIDNIIMAAEDVNGLLWISNVNDLLIWNPKTNKAKNISPPAALLPQDIANTEAANICRDYQNNMWVSYNGKGLAKFNANGKLLNFLTKEKNHLTTNRIRIIEQLQNKKLIIGAEDGFFILDPATLEVDSLKDHPLLKPFIKKRIVDIMPDGDAVWLAASPRGGAYCYNLKTKTLRSFTEKEGLTSNRVYSIGKDFYGNIYIGTYENLNVLGTDGKLTIINKQNGLRHTRVDNITTDAKGQIWITNFSTLICYNPTKKYFTYFDEQNGVSNAGFTIGQTVKTRDGKIIFCNNGLLIMDTSLGILQKEFIPTISIHRLFDDGGYDLLSSANPVKLPYNEAKISLYYLTNTLTSVNHFFYRYKMAGLDTGWQQPTKNNQVTYNLKPGKYSFFVQVSTSENDWQQNLTNITIIVLSPWWQTWWFIVLSIITMASLLYFLYRRRIRTIKAKAALQQQITELESKALRAQMNPHFIFNSLNAIQELIITENIEDGYRYLSSFSKLLRMVLNYSEKNFISLSNEIEVLKLYLSLEALRFRQSFNYNISVNENIETDIVQLPSLLLQPYVENAVWHGLRHKEGEKALAIFITEKGEQLEIIIEDNGVGREKSEDIKSKKLGAEKFESKGTLLATQRISILNLQYPGMATTKTIDLKDSDGKGIGTRVIITLPIIQQNK